MPRCCEDPGLAVDVGDRRAAGGGVGERRVVAHQAEVVLGDLDLAQVHRPDGPVGDLELVALAGSVVGDARVSPLAPGAVAVAARLLLRLVVFCSVAIRPPPRSQLRTSRFCGERRDSSRRQYRQASSAAISEPASKEPVVQAPVDEEPGRAGDAAGQAAVDVALHPRSACARGVELGRDPVGVEAELARRADQVSRAERAPRLVEAVVHRPERALGGGRLGCLGGALGVGMDVAQGEVAEREQQPPGELVADPLHDREGGGAVGALEVPVHDQLQLGSVRAVAVVLGGERRRQLGQGWRIVDSRGACERHRAPDRFWSVPPPCWCGSPTRSRSPTRSCSSSAGSGSGLIPAHTEIEVDPEVFFLVFLPPLLQSAGYYASRAGAARGALAADRAGGRPLADDDGRGRGRRPGGDSRS